MRWWLIAAGVYNLLWGGWVILFPGMLFDFAGMAQPNYPQLWQCIGMIVGVYGIGYLCAARDPMRHWPIVLVGLLGKVFGPIGFAQALWTGALPVAFGITILSNDLLWWVPFALILRHAWLGRERGTGADTGVDSGADSGARGEDLAATMDRAAAHSLEGEGVRSLLELSRERPTLVLFLRHFGCTFCREALSDLAVRREELSRRGMHVVIVHMIDAESARKQLDRFAIRRAESDVSRSGTFQICDPQRRVYQAFELRRGTFAELFGLRMWLRAFQAGLLRGHGVGMLQGDGFQMPGAFVVRDGRILAAHRHSDAADRVDVCSLATQAGASGAVG